MKIAIDGPVGSGKSTLARMVAQKLGYIYIDTGAMYRALGLFVVKSGKNPDVEKDVLSALDDCEINLELVDNIQQTYLNGENVSKEIRGAEVGSYASKVAVFRQVREKMVSLQRKIATDKNIVMDGRDIGTVVLPDAEVKIFLTASVDARTRRRCGELSELNLPCNYEEIKESIAKRDLNDSNRAESPLKMAKDAVSIDTSDMDAEAVVEYVLKIINEKM